MREQSFSMFVHVSEGRDLQGCCGFPATHRKLRRALVADPRSSDARSPCALRALRARARVEDAGGLRREFFNEFGRGCMGDAARGLWQLLQMRRGLSWKWATGDGVMQLERVRGRAGPGMCSEMP